MAESVPSNGDDPLDAVVAEYLEWTEAGVPPDRAELLAAHPDLADRLRAFFADLDRMGTQGEAFRLPDVTLPEDFGDYEFLSEIGRGGMGVVYRARQKSLGRVVALKMVLAGPLAGQEAMRRFREEAETLSRLDHANIVPIHEVGEYRGLPYFTMKLVEGEPLTRHLDRYAADPKAAATLLVKVCDAVRHAHARGVLHRDLKPGNILIDPAGEPHVTDFGLARRVEEVRTLTTTGAVLGTPEYMAPEQAGGVKDVTTAADVYGLGGVLYALLTGRPPFRADTAYATLRRVVEELPIPPRKVRPGVPRDLETVCLKCLEKEPARRYPSAADVGADLGRWLKGEPIVARSVGTLERLRKWARRRPTAAALLLVSLVSVALVLGGGSALAWQLATANGQLTAANRDLGDKTGELQATLGDLGGANARLDEALWLSRREVYNQQLARVGAVFETDPRTALDLLCDTDACPIDERDAAWRFYENAARGYELGSRPGMIVARGPAVRLRENYVEQRPHDPYQGHRWALVRAGDEPPGLTDPERYQAIKARPLQVIDLISGEVKATLPDADLGKHLSRSWTVISQDGDTAAWVGVKDQKRAVLVCDVKTGKTFDPGLEVKRDLPKFLVLSPTGRLILMVDRPAADMPERTQLVDARTGETVHEFGPDLAPFRTPVFSPDGRYLAFWSNPKKDEYAVTLFDTTTRKLLPAIPGEPALAHSPYRVPRDAELLFSPDGRHLLRFSEREPEDLDSVWKMGLAVHAISDGGVKLAHALEFPRSGTGVQFSPDGKYVGVSTVDEAVHLIDTATWKVHRRLAGAWTGREFAFGRDGTVYTSEESGLSARDADSGERRVVRRGDHGRLLGVSERNEISTTPHASSEFRGPEIHRWQLSPRTSGRTIPPCGRATAVGFSPDGQTFLRVITVKRRVKDDSVFDEPFRSSETDPVGEPSQKGYIVNGQRVYDDETTLQLDLITGRTTEHKGRLPGVNLGDVSRPEEFATKDRAASSRHRDRGGEEWTFEVKGHDGRASSVRPAGLTHPATARQRRWPVGIPAEAVVLPPPPDGQCVLIGLAGGAVELRDVWTGSVRATLLGHASVVQHAVWAADGQALATLARDGTMKVWAMRAPPAVARWAGTDLAFSADGASLVVCDWSSDQVQTRSLHTGRVERAFPRPTDGRFMNPRLTASADGRYLLGVGRRRPYVYDLATGADLTGRPAEGWDPTAASAAAAGGGFVVRLERHQVGGTDAKPEDEFRLVRSDLPDQVEQVLARFPAAGDRAWDGFLEVTADGRAVVVGQFTRKDRSPDGRETDRPTLTLRWYDAGTGEAGREVKLPSEKKSMFGTSNCACLHPSGKLALVQVQDERSSFRVYDLDTGKERWRLPEPGYWYMTAEFSPDGRWLAAVTDRGVVQTWEVETGRLMATDDLRRAVPTGSQSLSVQELRFDPAGRRLAARVKPVSSISSTTEQIVVWDLTPAK